MMQRKFKVAALLAAALSVSSAYAGAEEDFLGWLLNFQRQKNVKPVSDKQYLEECGGCHYAYQPGLIGEVTIPAFLQLLLVANRFNIFLTLKIQSSAHND